MRITGILAGIATLLFPVVANATAYEVLTLEVPCEWKMKVSPQGRAAWQLSEPECEPRINEFWLPPYMMKGSLFTPDPDPGLWIPESVDMVEVRCEHWRTVIIPVIHGIILQRRETWDFSEPYCRFEIPDRVDIIGKRLELVD